MAPFARGIVKPRSQKMRAILNISVEKKPPNPLCFPRPSLLDSSPCSAVLKKGNPVFDQQFDILNTQTNGFRKSAAPSEGQKNRFSRANRDAFNAHEMLGKFRFQARGSFTQGGDVVREDLLQVGRELFLVGWIKCRASFAVGHLQGDVCALSYMRRYLEKYRADVHSVSFYEENFGMPSLEYERLTAVNDYRAPAKKRQHALAAAEKMKAMQLQQESLREAQELERYYEEHCCLPHY